MAKCAGCGKFLSSSSAANCTTCPSLFHKGCVGLAETALVSKDWVCPECKKKLRRGDNSSTPVRNVSGSSAQDVPLQEPTVIEQPTVQDTVGVHALRRELAECMAEMREFRKEMADFRLSVAGITARMDGIELRLEAVEQQRAAAATEEITELERNVNLLKLELNDRDQEALQSDLEIGHLPEEKGENILHSVKLLAAKLGVTLEERDVVYAERVGVVQLAGAAKGTPRERRVVVRLARRCLRDELLQAARVRRTLTTTDAGRAPPAGSRTRIFINERLTRTNRILFHRVREECRKLQWRYSWTKRGRIYARQADGKPAHHIRSEADLTRVFGSALV